MKKRIKKVKKILTEEDKIKIAVASKNKPKKVNVYFNKRKSNSDATYLSGNFYSKKNNSIFIYRSSYELRHFLNLEASENIVAYYSEFIQIPYKDSKGTMRTYIPDLVVIDRTGTIQIQEIKPEVMLKDTDVQLKALACKKWIKEHLDKTSSYVFITEKDLFKTTKEYLDFIKEAKKTYYGP